MQIQIQYPGEEVVKLGLKCNLAIVAAPQAIKTIERASRVEYQLLKLQFIDRHYSFVADFAKM